jgi:hypothetical protein
MNPMAPRQRADRQPLAIAVTPDLFELLHSGFHSSVPPIRALKMSANRQATIGRRWGQFKRPQWGQTKRLHPPRASRLLRLSRPVECWATRAG